MGAIETQMELAAERLVARALGGRAVTTDVQGTSGMRDFDVVDAAGQTLAGVEVTSIQEPQGRATHAQIDRLRQTDIGLATSWSATVHEQRFMGPITKGAARVLNELDALGVTSFDSAEDVSDPAVQHLVAQANELGMYLSRTMPRQLPPRLYCSGWGSGSVVPEAVTAAVEFEATKPDNLKKLAAVPTAAERHLFVWVHHTAWELMSALLDPSWIILPATFPPEVDVIWIGVATGDWNSPDRLLRADHGNAWVDV